MSSVSGDVDAVGRPAGSLLTEDAWQHVLDRCEPAQLVRQRRTCRLFARLIQPMPADLVVGLRLTAEQLRLQRQVHPYHQLHGAAAGEPPAEQLADRAPAPTPAPAHRSAAFFRLRSLDRLFAGTDQHLGRLRSLRIVAGPLVTKPYPLDLAWLPSLRSLDLIDGGILLINPGRVYLRQLVRLHFDCIHAGQLLHYFPALQRLACPGSIVGQAGVRLPGRTLQRLHLRSQNTFPLSTLPAALAAGFERLEKLTVDAQLSALLQLAEFTTCRRLRFNACAYMETLGGQCVRQKALDELASRLDLDAVDFRVNGYRLRNRPDELRRLNRYLTGLCWDADSLAELVFDRRRADKWRARNLREARITDGGALDRPDAFATLRQLTIDCAFHRSQLAALPDRCAVLQELELEAADGVEPVCLHFLLRLRCLRRLSVSAELRLLQPAQLAEAVARLPLLASLRVAMPATLAAQYTPVAEALVAKARRNPDVSFQLSVRLVAPPIRDYLAACAPANLALL